MDQQYLLVDRADSEVQGLVRAAEITPTQAYKAVRGQLKTVALRLPDNCYLAQLHPGQNQNSAELESRCGIPLQVLESTLTREGYQVLSWSTLMGIEHAQNVPVHIAAQQLGADFVIIVNEMYVGQRPAGADAEAHYRYFNSDAHGKRVAPAELFQKDRDWLKGFIRDRTGGDATAGQNQPLQAVLNATVVLAKGTDPAAAAPAVGGTAAAAPTAATGARSGEAIWFYNWQLADQNHLSMAKRFLFAGVPSSQYLALMGTSTDPVYSDPNQHYWWPVYPDLGYAQPQLTVDRATSEETFASHHGVTPEDEARLYRQIAEDFIRRFKNG